MLYTNAHHMPNGTLSHDYECVLECIIHSEVAHIVYRERSVYLKANLLLGTEMIRPDGCFRFNLLFFEGVEDALCFFTLKESAVSFHW